jgi:hypothetical protein
MSLFFWKGVPKYNLFLSKIQCPPYFILISFLLFLTSLKRGEGCIMGWIRVASKIKAHLMEMELRILLAHLRVKNRRYLKD